MGVGTVVAGVHVVVLVVEWRGGREAASTVVVMVVVVVDVDVDGCGGAAVTTRVVHSR